MLIKDFIFFSRQKRDIETLVGIPVFHETITKNLVNFLELKSISYSYIILLFALSECLVELKTINHVLKKHSKEKKTILTVYVIV